MKLKSVVFTVALATAFSAYSDTVDVSWFTTNDTRVAYFDTTVDNPVAVTNTVAVPAGWTIAKYAITAHVTNLVVFAEKPSAALKTFDENREARGAICAAYKSSGSPATNSWYGLNYDGGESKFEWSELTSPSLYPCEGNDYKFRMDFATNNVKTVTYSVYDLTAGAPAVVGTACATKDPTSSGSLPNLYAFAGMGGCTNIVGEIVISVEGKTAVPLSDGSRVLLPPGTTPVQAETPQENGLKMWVNHVLGIDSPTVATKPYAAPVQNASTTTLDLKLGGVAVRDRNDTGAKVTYTIEELATPAASTSETEYSSDDPEQPVSIMLRPQTKYYRIKINIDPAH